MVLRPPSFDRDATVLVVGIGNTSITLAAWHGGQINGPLSIRADDDDALVQALAAHSEAMPGKRPATAVVASVAPRVLENVHDRLAGAVRQAPLIVGETIPLPMEVAVSNRSEIGVDRVCAAAAAYEKIETGCIVIDFGTAVTVDLIDDDGVLLGGAILPGVRMQFRALHERTALLPKVEPAFPDRPYGRNTCEAMQIGVCRGLIGAVRAIVEGYASFLNRWPQVLATGGDLEFLLPHCDFVDTPVAHLPVQGIGLAYAKHMAAHGA